MKRFTMIITTAIAAATLIGCNPQEADACDRFAVASVFAAPVITQSVVATPIVAQTFVSPFVSQSFVSQSFVSPFSTVAVTQPTVFVSAGFNNFAVAQSFGVNQVFVNGGHRNRGFGIRRFGLFGGSRSFSRSSSGGIFGFGMLGGSRSVTRVRSF